ncbi:MAG: threonine-phosphate decarboxylase CobD [Thermoleophilia bacterium]|nr:threonine-phosphate decarboxylase CobD [Thermoleophilia bacterium]
MSRIHDSRPDPTVDDPTADSTAVDSPAVDGSSLDNPAIAETGAAPAHGGRREEAARRYGIPKEELLDFSASINLLGPSPAALNAIKAAAVDIHYYPEESADEFARLVAGYLGVFPDEVVPGNGSIEVIYWMAAALRPRRVLIVEPTFSEYRRACESVGAICDAFPLRGEEGFAFDAERLDPQGYDMVFLCNPNNPTGYLIPVDEVAALWKRCRSVGAGLVVDEAFIDFAGPEQSILLFGASEGLYVLRSFTKSHALAGLRLGCLVAETGFAELMRSLMPPWNVNSFALAAGGASLRDWDYMPRSRDANSSARSKLYADFDGIPGIDPVPSEANFLLCRLDGAGSEELADELGRQGILVRDCRSFPGLGDRYIRVAVRSERDNYQLVSAVRKALG